MIYCDTTAVEAMRTLSGRFSRGETTMDEFTVGCRRINDMSDRRKIEAQAARDNLVFLRARMTSLTNLQNAITHEDIQTKKLTELAVQQQKLIESLNDARKNKEAALKAFADSAKLIEANGDVPMSTSTTNVTPFCSDTQSFGYCGRLVCGKPILRTHAVGSPGLNGGIVYCSRECAIDKSVAPIAAVTSPCVMERSLRQCHRSSCGRPLFSASSCCPPYSKDGRSYCSVECSRVEDATPIAASVVPVVTTTATPARPIKYCDSKACSDRVIQPVTRGDLTGREFCSVQCALSAHPTMIHF
jgi:hypothetical protein